MSKNCSNHSILTRFFPNRKSRSKGSVFVLRGIITALSSNRNVIKKVKISMTCLQRVCLPKSSKSASIRPPIGRLSPLETLCLWNGNPHTSRLISGGKLKRIQQAPRAVDQTVLRRVQGQRTFSQMVAESYVHISMDR